MDITIPNSVTSIANSAFEGCTGLTSVMIPDSVTSIGGSAFRSCTGLISVVIPNKVTSIRNYVFYKCVNLETIYFFGSNEQWDAIEKGDGWDWNAGFDTSECKYALICIGGSSDIRFEGNYIYGIEPGTTVEELEKALGCEAVITGTKNGLVGTGTKLTVGGKECTVIIRGDIDGDGRITSTDYIKVRQYILKQIQLEGESLLAARTSPDADKEFISAFDYAAIRRHILKRKLIRQ